MQRTAGRFDPLHRCLLDVHCVRWAWYNINNSIYSLKRITPSNEFTRCASILYQARKCYKTIDRSSLALALEREMFALEHELFGDCEMSAVFKVLLWKAPRNRIHFTFFDFLIQFDFLKFRGLLLKPNFSQSTPGQTFMNVVCRIHECGWKCKVIGGGDSMALSTITCWKIKNHFFKC